MTWLHLHGLGWNAFLALALAAIWLSRLIAAARGIPKIAEISGPEWDLAPVDATGRTPRVSIVVCALNEEAKIEPALRSLLELDYPDYEVVAVDDRSTDNTGTIMDRIADEYLGEGHHHLRVVHVAELPPGWLGKVHAMWNATDVATGDLDLFTDADVVFSRDALRRAIAYAEKDRADHVVLFPTMLMYTWDERMMIAFFQAMFVFGHRPWKTADPKARDHMGVGAFNLIRRSTYEAIGTYERMRLSVVDDMKLGELVKQGGFAQRNSSARSVPPALGHRRPGHRPRTHQELLCHPPLQPGDRIGGHRLHAPVQRWTLCRVGHVPWCNARALCGVRLVHRRHLLRYERPLQHSAVLRGAPSHQQLAVRLQRGALHGRHLGAGRHHLARNKISIERVAKGSRRITSKHDWKDRFQVQQKTFESIVKTFSEEALHAHPQGRKVGRFRTCRALIALPGDHPRPPGRSHCPRGDHRRQPLPLRRGSRLPRLVPLPPATLSNATTRRVRLLSAN